MTLTQVQDQIIEDFSVFDDWMDRYQQLIELGKDLKPIDENKRTEQYLIKGCQSKVWLDAEMVDGRIYFTADSDAIITKGIVSLLIKVLDGRTPQEIIDADLYFIDKIGLKENLSPTRSNGLVSMVKQTRLYALAYQAKAKGRDCIIDPSIIAQ
jgi:cysteine desulfuration protein SufE